MRQDVQDMTEQLEAMEDRSSHEAFKLAGRLGGKTRLLRALDEQAKEMMGETE